MIHSARVIPPSDPVCPAEPSEPAVADCHPLPRYLERELNYRDPTSVPYFSAERGGAAPSAGEWGISLLGAPVIFDVSSRHAGSSRSTSPRWGYLPQSGLISDFPTHHDPGQCEREGSEAARGAELLPAAFPDNYLPRLIDADVDARRPSLRLARSSAACFASVA